MLDIFIIFLLGIGLIAISKVVKIITENPPSLKQKTAKDETPV